MMRLLALLFVATSLSAQMAVSGGIVTSPGIALIPGQPTISGLTETPDANTIVLSWTTSAPSNTQASCGGNFAPEDATQNLVTSHQIAVPQLHPSTTYTCSACSGGACQTISATTSAYATSTPVTGISLGTPTDYNATSPPHTMTGDILVNAVSNDGTTYVGTTDTSGWDGAANCSYSTILAKFTSLSPMAATDVNTLSGYGPGCVPQSSIGNLSPKLTGLFAMDGRLFMPIGLASQCSGNIACLWFYGSMAWSPDHGLTWNNMTNPATFTTTGAYNSPYTTRLSPAGAPFFDMAGFVMFGADDGTLGYSVPANRVLNGNSYVYMISNALNSTGASASAGDSYYLKRVPRSQLADNDPSEYTYYVGGDGTQASAWSTTQTASVPILTNEGNGANLPTFPGELNIVSTQYIPALNRFMLITCYWPLGVGTFTQASSSTCLYYDSPTPWGPFTLVGTVPDTTDGSYGVYMLQADALAATFTPTTMRIIYNENYLGPHYNMFIRTLTVLH